MSVRELQEAFGFETPQAIYKWQHGTALPTIDNLVILSAGMCGWMKFLYCRKGVRRNHYNTKLEQYKTGNKLGIIERKK